MTGQRGWGRDIGRNHGAVFRTIAQAANGRHEEGEKVRSSKRICTLVELSLSAQRNDLS